MSSGRQIRIVLFFTRGVSLVTWDRIGMFDREVALYRRLLKSGVDVSFVTYGDRTDLTYADRLPGIRLLVNRWGFPGGLYDCLIPFLHGPALVRATVYKTNQIDGAGSALKASRLWRKPLIARCGYMWSDFAQRQHGTESAIACRARREEQALFNGAERIVVTTRAMYKDVGLRIPGAVEKTTVIPNYVDTSCFFPDPVDNDRKGVIFVGRLSPQKNVDALVEALSPLHISLTLIGDGELRMPLQDRFGNLNGRLRWLGNVPHGQLPRYLNSASLFVLPSLYEGHPKALIEAMACGLPVVGGDSPGIREWVQHGETGWLCRTDPESIREAVVTLLEQPALRKKLGQNARNYVERQCSLDHIVDLELNLFKGILAR